MKFIGITGGVGAGKSTVLAYLKENYKCHENLIYIKKNYSSLVTVHTPLSRGIQAKIPLPQAIWNELKRLL